MSRQLLQYQKLAEPLEPSLTVAPPELSWYFQHPSQPPPRRRTAHYLPFATTTEATTFSTTVFQVAPVLLGNIVKDTLFQYQSRSAPVEPIPTAAPDLSWFFQFPNAPPPRKRTANYLPYEKTVEPSLYVTPSLDTFYHQQPSPPLPRKRAANFLAFVYVGEPTAVETPPAVPSLDGWVQPVSQPLNRFASRRHVYPDHEKPLEPSLFTATQVDMWYFQHPTKPPARTLPIAHYPTFVKPWEPTTYLVPDLSTWFFEHPTKPPPKPRSAEYLPFTYVAEPTAWDIILVPPLDGWTQPISQPLFDKPRAAWFEPFVGQPLEPSLFTAVAIDWYVESFNPVLRKPQAAWMQPYHADLEPSLFGLVPDMSTWYVQHPPRLLPLRRTAEFQFCSPTLETGGVPGLDVFHIIVTGSDELAYTVTGTDEGAYRVEGSDASY